MAVRAKRRKASRAKRASRRRSFSPEHAHHARQRPRCSTATQAVPLASPTSESPAATEIVVEPRPAAQTMPAETSEPPHYDLFRGFSEVERDFFLGDLEPVEEPIAPALGIGDRFHGLFCELSEQLRDALFGPPALDDLPALSAAHGSIDSATKEP